MKSIVLVSGELTQEKIGEVQRECEWYHKRLWSGGIIQFVIDSPGGNSLKTLELLDYLEKVAQKHPIHAKIYRAGSSAALIAFCAREREMKKEGLITIHLPYITELRFSQLDSEGRVPKDTLATGREIRRKTFELMERTGIPKDGPHIDYLLGNESVTFDAETCLKFGVVSRVI